MRSLSTVGLTLFLALLSLHLGLSMELAAVSLIGVILCVVAAFRAVEVEKPTWGLIFVLMATGGFIGNQILEEWAIEGSWPRENGLGAGLVLSLFLYLLWVFASRDPSRPETPVDRSGQTVLVMGSLLMLLIPPPEVSTAVILGAELPLITLAGMLVATSTALADRCSTTLRTRLALLLPLVLIVPLTTGLLRLGQGPTIAAISSLFPTGGNYRSTGFSPYQRLDPSVFLRPSTRAVLRISGNQLPSRYLVGNRLSVLNEELVWLPAGTELEAKSSVDAELTATGEWRYTLENNHASSAQAPSRQVTLNSLGNDNFIFLAPGTTHVSGRFEGMSKDANNVWTLSFDRGSSRRWRMETGGSARADEADPLNLQLPGFWDDRLQDKSRSFSAPTRQLTVDNVVQHFTSREYALRTDFDPEQPFHDFYLNEQPGYCFWFATATTLALRANNIPSRLVSGYAVNEQISDKLWLVRQRDAHSWVEWQDNEGYWHTVDPTPASITGFFGGYRSNQASITYHYLAGQWQRFIDFILADERIANLVRYSGILILIFLFTREYRRLRSDRRPLESEAKRWQDLWQKFQRRVQLPVSPEWTASDYAASLPSHWPPAWHAAVRDFLHQYNRYRFAPPDAEHFIRVEQALERCLRTLAVTKPESKDPLP